MISTFIKSSIVLGTVFIFGLKTLSQETFNDKKISNKHHKLVKYFNCPALLTMPANDQMYKIISLPKNAINITRAFDILISNTDIDPQLFDWLHEHTLPGTSCDGGNGALYTPSSYSIHKKLSEIRLKLSLERSHFPLALEILRANPNFDSEILVWASNTNEFFKFLFDKPDFIDIFLKYFVNYRFSVFLVPWLSVDEVVQLMNLIAPLYRHSSDLIYAFGRKDHALQDGDEYLLIYERNKQIFDRLPDLLVVNQLRLVNVLRFLPRGQEKEDLAVGLMPEKFEKAHRSSIWPVFVQICSEQDESKLLLKIFERVEDRKFIYVCRFPDIRKWRIIEDLPDDILYSYFEFHAPLYRALLEAGVSKVDAYDLSSIFNRVIPPPRNHELFWLSLETCDRIKECTGIHRFFLIKRMQQYVIRNNLMDEVVVFYERLQKFKSESVVDDDPGYSHEFLVTMGNLKNLFKHPNYSAIVKLIANANTPSYWELDAPMGQLLNCDFCFESVMRHRKLFYTRFKFNFEDLIKGLDYSKIRRAFQFVNASKVGCNVVGNSKTDLTKFLYVKSSTFKALSLDNDMLPYMAAEMNSDDSTKEMLSPFIKLNEFWFQENPISMLKWAPIKTLMLFKHRFSPVELALVQTIRPAISSLHT